MDKFLINRLRTELNRFHSIASGVVTVTFNDKEIVIESRYNNDLSRTAIGKIFSFIQFFVNDYNIQIKSKYRSDICCKSYKAIFNTEGKTVATDPYISDALIAVIQTVLATGRYNLIGLSDPFGNKVVGYDLPFNIKRLLDINNIAI